jgi:hypothetical protein
MDETHDCRHDYATPCDGVQEHAVPHPLFISEVSVTVNHAGAVLVSQTKNCLVGRASDYVYSSLVVNMRRYTPCFLLFAALICRDVSAADRTGFDDPAATMSDNDNLDAMIREGYRFDNIEMVVHRCTMGSWDSDQAYGRRKQQMQTLNMLWGAFMFVREDELNRGQDAQRQADHFLDRVTKQRGPTKADRVVLSVNWFRYAHDKKYATPALVSAICEKLHDETGLWPVVFVDIDLLNELLVGATDDDGEYTPPQFNERITSILANCPLWLSFVETDQKFPPQFLPGSPWNDWDFCFYSSADFPKYAKRLPDGSVVPADLSYFKGGRGAPLENWYEAHSWNYERKRP